MYTHYKNLNVQLLQFGGVKLTGTNPHRVSKSTTWLSVSSIKPILDCFNVIKNHFKAVFCLKISILKLTTTKLEKTIKIIDEKSDEKFSNSEESKLGK